MPILAINGGTKSVTISEPHYTWPVITEKTEKAVLRQLHESISIYNKSGIIDTLEKRLAAYHGVKHALLTCTGTAGLHTAYLAANLQHGDEVICPVYTFFATVSPLLFTGAAPVFVDCDVSGNIDPAQVEQKITPRTKAIVVTHMWGLPCDMDRICAIAKKYNLLLIEDASHAHGTEYKSQKVGSFGDIAIFSLQGQKTLTSGEGGVILTNSDELYYRSIFVGHYNKRCLQEIPKENPLYEFGVTGMGLKLRIHPLAAAIADEQLDNLDTILEGRRALAQKMIAALGCLPGLTMPLYANGIRPAWYAFNIRFDGGVLGGLSIDKFYKALVAEGCTALDRPLSTCPLNHLPLFRKPEQIFQNYCKLKFQLGEYPQAEHYFSHVLKLPVWHQATDEKTMNAYVRAFEKVVNNYKELL